MDKKNLTIGVVLLLAAFAIIFFGPRSTPQPPPSVAEPSASSATPGSTPAATTPGQAAPSAAEAPTTAFAQVNRDAADATVTVLKNDYIEARFTNSGGALREVAFIKRDEKKNRLVYPAKLGGDDPFVFNALHADPMLAFVDYAGLDRNARYERVSQTATEVVYRAQLNGGLEVTRRYAIAPSQAENTDPYQIRHETTVRNISEQTSQPMTVKLALGTAAPSIKTTLGCS